MPLPAKTLKITFEALGAPEYFVTVKRLPGMKYADMQRIFALPDNMKDLERIKFILKNLVLEWNLKEDDNDNVILPIPSVDESSIDKIPASFINHISDVLKRDSDMAEESRLGFLNGNRTS